MLNPLIELGLLNKYIETQGHSTGGKMTISLDMKEYNELTSKLKSLELENQQLKIQHETLMTTIFKNHSTLSLSVVPFEGKKGG